MPRQQATRSMSLTSQESYSAVIIADMIAEVPNQIDHPDVEQGIKAEKHQDGKNSTPKKERINLGYDDKHDPPAVVNVDTMETVTLGQTKTNGTDITKGVILNAQFATNNKIDSFAAEKSIEMNNTAQVGEVKKEAKENVATSFREMSIFRKTAFIFSFLPSIMFVLCFAVILPCEKKVPCIREMWSQTLNYTRVTTDIKFTSESFFYSYIRTTDGPNAIVSLKVESGEEIWTKPVAYEPYLVDCTKLVANSSDSCLVAQPTKAFQLLEASSGNLTLNVDLPQVEGSSTSLPVILPDCHGNGISEFGLAVSNKEIKVIYQGAILSTVNVQGCDSVPSKLTPWKRRDSQTDLVFICQKDGKDQLVKMSQDAWCTYKKKDSAQGETKVLQTGEKDSYAQSVFMPTEDGLVVWNQNEVSLFDPLGDKNWTVSSLPHSRKNRFLLHGKFSESGTQIAMFSSDISQNLLITLLDYGTGEVQWNRTSQNTQIADISLMKGEKKDFVLVSMQKMEIDLKAEAITQLTSVPTTIVSMLTEEAATTPGQLESSASTLVDQIAFMELGGSYYHTIKEAKVSTPNGDFHTSLTVVPRPKNEIAILILKRNNLPAAASQLTSLGIKDWDISLTENRECGWSV